MVVRRIRATPEKPRRGREEAAARPRRSRGGGIFREWSPEKGKSWGYRGLCNSEFRVLGILGAFLALFTKLRNFGRHPKDPQVGPPPRFAKLRNFGRHPKDPQAGPPPGPSNTIGVQEKRGQFFDECWGIVQGVFQRILKKFPGKILKNFRDFFGEFFGKFPGGPLGLPPKIPPKFSPKN